jgi:hypothetical protein
MHTSIEQPPMGVGPCTPRARTHLSDAISPEEPPVHLALLFVVPAKDCGCVCLARVPVERYRDIEPVSEVRG